MPLPLPLAIVAVVLFLVSVVGYPVVAVHIYRRLGRDLRDHGIRSPAVLGVARGGVAAVTLLGVALVVRVAGPDDALLWALALVLVVPLVGVGLVRLLPRREARVAGARVVRLAYRPVGMVLFGTAGLLAAGAGLTQTPQLLRFALALVPVGFACLAIARRSGAPDATEVLRVDPRPPVLYLRAFASEQDVFAQVPRDRWLLVRDWLDALLRGESRRHVSFEELAGAEISRRIGPLVALGNPTDFVPPDGAARRYAPDDTWIRDLDVLARRARCIVVVPAATAHVVRELAHVRAAGLQDLVVVVTPPAAPPRTPVRAVTGRVSRLLTTPAGRRRMQPADWAEVSTTLLRAGYQPVADPGPGAVVGFDGEARGVVVRRDARTAAELVAAIHGWVAGGWRDHQEGPE